MDDRLSRIEATLRELDRRVRELEHSGLRSLDPAAPTPRHVHEDAPMPPGDAPAALIRHDLAADVLTLTGRTLVALGGAYLLRALTDSKMLPLPMGVAFGFAYAAAWLAAADRDGRRGAAISAAFHALVSCLVAFPLVSEATVRFKLLEPAASAGVLTAATLAAVAVAVHVRLQTAAWMATALAIPTTFALIAATGAAAPYAVSLVTVGITTLWIGYAWDWIWLRWPWALAADIVVFALAVRATSDTVNEPAVVVLAIQMLLLNAYLGSIVLRTIVRARDVIVFEVIQTVAALAVGFGGAVYVARQRGLGADALALVNLAFGAGCYGVAFVFVRERPKNFSFYCTLALVLIVVSGQLLLAPQWLTVAFDALALASIWAAARIGSVALTGHAAVYLTAAAAASQLLSSSLRALTAPAAAWTPFEWPAVLTLAASLVCWTWPMARRAELPAFEWTPRVAVAALATMSAAAWVVSIAAPLVGAAFASGRDAGAIATVRTAALAAAALLLGRVGRCAAFRESSWLLYPLLVAGALKLLIEDFPQSQPATLFVALAVYGGALIAAPRLSRRRA